MSLDFLAPSTAGAAVARSPMEGCARAAGAAFDVRDGWNLAVAYPATAAAVGWADVSHLPKWELQGPAAGDGLTPGTAVRREGGWWCRLTATRALVVGGSGPGAEALDVTCAYAALALVGPLAREAIARFCALDLRPAAAPVGALRPGSMARQPGIVIRESEDRYLLLFGWATGEYVWSVVADAAGRLGGGPLGVDALAQVDA